MASQTKDIKKPVTLPAPNNDFYQLTDVLSQAERDKLKQVRAFMESQVAPVINKYWAEDSFLSTYLHRRIGYLRADRGRRPTSPTASYGTRSKP